MGGTLAVGFFDGVHLGHQAILKGADEALTFRTHPLAVLSPARAPRLIMSFEERAAAIRACGVGVVAALDFSPTFADLAAKPFAEAYLSGWKIRCGANWRFGKGGRGDADFLRSLGYDVTVVPAVERGGEPISSTRIRAALESGRLDEANAMLGRPFVVLGVPFKGKGMGRSLGFPTVNLRLRDLSLRLPLGVYAVKVGEARGVANFGLAPSFGERAWTEPVLEIHFVSELPREVDLMQATEVRFHAFVRPERKFASLAELRAQIAADVAAGLI